MAPSTSVAQQSIRTKDTIFFNPFPGLRPFGINESHLFFGREGQSDEVLRKLGENRFSAVLGASGSGKSSLMYCGLLPILYGGFIAKAGSQWHTVVTRPGSSPIDNLAKALVDSIYPKDTEEHELKVQRNITSTILRSSSLGLIEGLKQLGRPKKENILILVDQFEELFRFKKSRTDSSSDNEAQAFVKIIVEAINQPDIPVYVVLTMRSDFIGDCAQFPELTQKINNSHYLIPQMTREDLRDAITGPVAVGGGVISTRLVEQLLNSVGDNPDQLPILQHALMRTWDYWSENRLEDEPMDLKHYDAIGRMEEGLSKHANEAYDELSESEKILCERIFKSLTEKGTDNRGIRSPSSLAELQSITEASSQEIIQVVNRFRKAGRSFLTPSHEQRMEPTTIVDISHESLMRVWDRLKYWVDEEAQSIQMYLRLAEAALLYQQGKSGLWRPPDLQLALTWREKQKPNLQWAEQYDPAFERAMVFLDTSAYEYELEEQNKIRQQKKALRRTRVFAIVLGSFAVLALGVMLYAVVQQQEANKQRLLALENEKAANDAKAEALASAAEANRQKERAEELAALAKKEADNAREQSERATRLAEVAKRNEQKAQDALIRVKQSQQKLQQQILLVQQAEEKARQEADNARRSFEEAERERDKAKKSNEEALNLRMLAIGQQMAVKSLQINRDTTKKALIAYQAYNFNKNYGGKPHNSDIYSGLYYALKSLKPEEYNALEGHDQAIRSLAFSSSGDKMYSTGSDGQILQYDLSSGAHEPKEFRSLDNINRALALNEEHGFLAVATESGVIQLIDLNEPSKKPTQLKGHQGVVWDVETSPDGTIYSTGADRKVYAWRKDNPTPELFAEHHDRLRDLTVSKDGRFMAAGTEGGELLMWNLETKKMRGALERNEGNKVYAVEFSADGSMLVSGDQIGNVKIWDMETMSLKTSLEGQSAQINQIRFSPDGKMVAAASFDGSVQLWDLEHLNDQPLVLKDHKFWVWALAFSPDSQKLVTGCADGLARIWATSSETMASEICNKIDRNMSKKEWTRYVAETNDVPYEKTCEDYAVGEGITSEDQKQATKE